MIVNNSHSFVTSSLHSLKYRVELVPHRSSPVKSPVNIHIVNIKADHARIKSCLGRFGSLKRYKSDAFVFSTILRNGFVSVVDRNATSDNFTELRQQVFQVFLSQVIAHMDKLNRVIIYLWCFRRTFFLLSLLFQNVLNSLLFVSLFLNITA